MKTIKVILFFILTFSFCVRSQGVKPKNKAKIDSLYPNGKIYGWNGPHGRTQDILIICNCPEFDGEMQLTFDTNANILVKTYYYFSLNPLPDTILRYMKQNTSKTVKFDTGCSEKNINFKGEISYMIRDYKDGAWFDIIFKETGEIISKTKEIRFSE